MTKFNATFHIGNGSATTATGCEAQTITAMFAAGPRGISSLDTLCWLGPTTCRLYFRLAQNGHTDPCRRVRHTGGNRGRYFLVGPVHQIKVIDATTMAVAA